jgi:hypothetical protein
MEQYLFFGDFMSHIFKSERKTGKIGILAKSESLLLLIYDYFYKIINTFFTNNHITKN